MIQHPSEPKMIDDVAQVDKFYETYEIYTLSKSYINEFIEILQKSENSPFISEVIRNWRWKYIRTSVLRLAGEQASLIKDFEKKIGLKF